jgi:hypothetical protein
VSEEPIHDRCAGLDDGPDLMPVDQFGDVGAAVADELCDFLEGTPASESSETKECRNSRGVQSAGLSPGTRARARRRSRRMFGGVHASAEPGGEHEPGVGPPLQHD